jgi:uncharacterized LabA/DUF88 family protein
MKRAIVFIDGGNFYFQLKKLTAKLNGKYKLLNFNFEKFSKWLVSPNELVEARYYIGAINQQNNNEKSKRMYADQQRLFMNLQKQNIGVVLGELIQHSDKSYHEKGVDVRIAVEMIRMARRDKYDTAYLLSSDTDLVPAVEEVISIGKKVHYIGISERQSFGLAKTSNETRLLRAEEIKDFLPNALI